MLPFIRQKLHNYVEEMKTKDDQWQLKLTRNNKEYSVLRAEADNLSAVAKFSASNAPFDTSNIRCSNISDPSLIEKQTE